MSTRSIIGSLEIAERTDPGRDPDKQVNEDAVAHAETPLGVLALVCDGMGGHAGGKEASELAVRTILEVMGAATPKTSPREALRVALEEANRRIWGMPTAEAGYRPGSTVVAVLVHEGGAEVAHVGDSRVYLVHAGAVSQVTRDHSMVQEMVDRKIIRPEDAATHPDANKILRALGIAKEVEVEVRPEPIRYVAGDVIVMCSDGLSDLVGAAEILDLAGSQPPPQAAGKLVDLANARGGHDNITALVLRFKATASASDAATIVKTVAITAHDVPAITQNDERPAGAGGTLVAAPIDATTKVSPGQTPSTKPRAPPVAPSSGSALGSSSPNVFAQGAAIPPTPPGSRPVTRAPERRSVLPVLGVVLALVGLGLLVGLYFVLERKPHRVPVPIALPEAGTASTKEPEPAEDAGGPARRAARARTGCVRRGASSDADADAATRAGADDAGDAAEGDRDCAADDAGRHAGGAAAPAALARPTRVRGREAGARAWCVGGNRLGAREAVPSRGRRPLALRLGGEAHCDEPHDLGQVLGVERLVEDDGGAFRGGAPVEVGIAEAGHEHDRLGPARGAEAAEHVVAGRVRHPHVHHEHVGDGAAFLDGAPEDVEHGLAVVRGRHVESGPRELGDEQRAELGVVLRDHHARGRPLAYRRAFV